ncbi:thioredoxin family protein [Liquorilactobacillus cacaonum]|uniref:Thioredoxin n=1 Tax=Liquorilactobacillus cacaonum DSM 21116 TaxID=1423729 RepID=A0A0R2CQZ6_9LACO|nr:thioredoxin family protein [Liquorilactobacillus cacaonum]KRM90604.1 thioredoxin [Liquorilactobacillus cacaonum DSM 21116]
MEQFGKMNLETLEKKLAKGSFVLFFSAGWCSDCSFIKPSLPEIEEEYKDYKFIHIDRDENIELCQEMMVMGIPSFIVYKDGKEVARFVNKDRKTKEEVESFLNGVA